MTGQATLHDVTTRGKRIKTARLIKGHTQHSLALAIDSQAFEVSRWENDRHRPSDAKLARIADVLGVTIEWLEAGDTDSDNLAA